MYHWYDMYHGYGITGMICITGISGITGMICITGISGITGLSQFLVLSPIIYKP